MLPAYVYFLLGLALLLAALLLLPFRRGRRLLVAALPALGLFALLATVAEAAYRIGAARAPRAASAEETIYTCAMHPQVRQKGPGLCPICHMELVPLATVAEERGPGLTIDPVVVQNMGVRVQEVVRGPLRRTVRAFGVLRAPEPAQRDVALKFDGFVERLYADTEGMRIEQGAPLFTVYAPELVVAQEELIAARRSGDGPLLAAARQKLLLLDVPAAEVDRLQALDAAQRALPWPSPAAGTLLRREIVAGAPAARNQVLLRIADLSTLWLDAQVPEAQLDVLQPGQEAQATFPGAPGLEVAGKVVFVAPTLDERSRTAAVRVEVPNATGRLRPGMFARLAFPTVAVPDALLVPLEAVLDTGLRQLAWVAVGKGKFAPRPLRLGPAGDGGLQAVLAGLEPGERVVVSGQFLIDAESRLREGTRKFGAEGLLPGGELPPRAPAALSAGTQQAVDALLGAYLQVQQDMARDRHDAGRWRALADAAAKVAAAPEHELQLLAGALAQALQQPADQDLVAARVAFKAASAAAERLFEVARPRASGAGTTLYVLHCPMAEADWLQLDARVRNPYYGSSMPDCGAARRQLPLAAAEGHR